MKKVLSIAMALGLMATSSVGVFAATEPVMLHDEELGYIPPQEFIPLAEKDGDIMELGRQIFAKTCHFISEHDLDALGIDF